MTTDLERARMAFAERLRQAVGLRSAALVRAFARVPREYFVGPGPWKILVPPITNDTPPDFAPVWSPDSKQVAYVSTRGSYSGIYRKAADGTGSEELLFRYTPGTGMALTDWSPDGMRAPRHRDHLFHAIVITDSTAS